MPHSWRALRPVLLVMILVSLLAVPVSHAQDTGGTQEIKIVGAFQPEVQTLMTALTDGYKTTTPDAAITPALSGESSGFTDMCSGAADIAVSTTAISDDQIARCGKGANFVETVLAYEIVTLVAPPASEVTCPTQEQINNLWQSGGSPAGDVPADVTWAYLNSATTLTTPIKFMGPQNFTSIYSVFAGLVPAGALRDDIETVDDVAQMITAVTAPDSSVMGFMSLSDLHRVDPTGTVVPLGITNKDGLCAAPSAESMATKSYPLARTLYLYVNATSAARPEVQALMQYILSDNGSAIVEQNGYTAPTSDVYTTGVGNVTNARVGRTFTRPITPVNASTQEVGQINVGGTSVFYPLTKTMVSNFNKTYPLATVQVNTLGNSAGWDAICGTGTPATIDVLQTTQPISADQKSRCDLVELNYGYEAIVFAVPTSADWVDCLTVDQISTLLRAGTTDTPAVTNWNQINPDWPDKSLLIVAPPRSSGDADYIIANLIKDLKFLVRDDMTESDDPLYRAQGVANTDNGITFLRWSDLQISPAKDSLKLLGVDAGNGCKAPSAETMTDGTYPLSYPVRYYFNRANFAQNALLRAFLWSFFDDANLNQLPQYAGLDVEALRGMKDSIFNMLAEYEIAAPAPTGTEEPSAQGTEAAPVATEEAAPAATATVEPAATEAAPAATAEATAAATAEPAATQAAQ